ncbi:MAG TPA: ABC transporter permease, partial [Candidatus Synoicihabitans sp.]|nr:ABC transporter permease [Candidatus Synoicihabitans sp.]
MNWRNIGTVYRKELRDLLRDRRTIISMIIIPTLLIPAMIFVVGSIAVKVVKKAQREVPAVMLLGGDHSPRVQEALAGDEKLRLVPPADDWRTAVAEKRIRAAVEVPPGFQEDLQQGRPTQVKLYHYEGELSSGLALRLLRERLNVVHKELVAERLAARGLEPAVIDPFRIASENVAPPEKVGGNAFGGFLPYIFLLLCFTGAMYPAMDLTAGEKERGTMETILVSPIARLHLVLGKFFMVLTASLGTVAFSLASMLVSMLIASQVLMPKAAASAANAAAPRGGPLPSLDPVGLIGVVIMILPFAVFFSALLLALSLFAKSFKEAQSYVSPLIIVIILPAVVGMLPGVELSTKLALVPVLNLSLVCKEMVSGV